MEPSPPSAAPASAPLPRRLLFTTSARVGGIGLDLDVQEQLKLSLRGGYLGRAVAYQNRSPDIPHARVRSLRLAPVRLVSFLDAPYYYGAKRRYAGHVAAGEVRTGRYDFFHGWAGDSLAALRAARERGLPSVLDIPTFHVAHGFRRGERVQPPRGRAGCCRAAGSTACRSRPRACGRNTAWPACS